MSETLGYAGFGERNGSVLTTDGSVLTTNGSVLIEAIDNVTNDGAIVSHPLGEFAKVTPYVCLLVYQYAVVYSRLYYCTLFVYTCVHAKYVGDDIAIVVMIIVTFFW